MNLSLKEMFRASWALFKKHAWPFSAATAIIMAISFVSRALTNGGEDGSSTIVGIVTAVLMWWLYAGFLRMALVAHQGGAVNINFIFAEKWNTLVQFAITSILTGLAVVAGLVLVVIPGLIVQTALLFGAFFVIDKGMKGVDAMKASWSLTKGHRWPVFWALLVLVLLNILGALPAGLGLLVTIPVTVLALTHLYSELEKNVQPYVISTEPKKE